MVAVFVACLLALLLSAPSDAPWHDVCFFGVGCCPVAAVVAVMVASIVASMLSAPSDVPWLVFVFFGGLS